MSKDIEVIKCPHGSIVAACVAEIIDEEWIVNRLDYKAKGYSVELVSEAKTESCPTCDRSNVIEDIIKELKIQHEALNKHRENLKADYDSKDKEWKDSFEGDDFIGLVSDIRDDANRLSQIIHSLEYTNNRLKE